MNPANPEATPAFNPYRLALFWWDVAAESMQLLWTAQRITTACLERWGQASVSAGLSALNPVLNRSQAHAVPPVPPGAPQPATPEAPTPTPDPLPPDISDPPPVEVPPPPFREPPVMPTPVANAAHLLADGSEDPGVEWPPGAPAPSGRA